MRRLDQRGEQPGIDYGVVIQEEYVLGADLQRPAHAEIVASGVSQISSRADNLHLWKRGPYRRNRVVAGGVVHHMDLDAGIVDSPKGLKARERVFFAVPV